MKLSPLITLMIVLLFCQVSYAQRRRPKKSAPNAPIVVVPTDRIVAVRFMTDPDGNVTYTRVMSGDSAYYDCAVAGAKKLKFSRRRYRGQLISTAGIVVYKFVGERPVIIEMHKGKAVTTD